MSGYFEGISEQHYVAVDDIPEIAAERMAVREAALATIEQRQQQLAAGQEAEVPVVLDALSTADKVLALRARFGEESEAYQEGLAGLDADCGRLVQEWYRKKRPEYFEPITHEYDATTEDFFSHGWSIRQMSENALRPIADDPEEERRRINERVEDATPLMVKKLGGFALGQSGLRMRTISECTDKAIRDYKADMVAGAPHRGYGGYVPEIEKVMLRDMYIDPQTNNRIQEQVGLPGTYITHTIIQEALRRRGMEAADKDKTELHGTQILARDSLLGFVALLDEVASEQWCTNIFLGEEVAKDMPKDYEKFRAEARARQEKLRDMATTARNFILDLAEAKFDRRRAPRHVENFVKKLLLDMAKQDQSVAEQIFDARTAEGLKQVAYLESIGQYDLAFARMQAVEQAAPGGGYCSGGSCGLESVNIHSETGKELAEKLQAKSGDTIVRDTERACKCGAKKIVYAYNANKVNKYCEGCKAFESKNTSGGRTAANTRSK